MAMFRKRWTTAGVLSLLALLTANALFISFSMRQIKAEDLGYHVRYGLTFFESGRLVDCNQQDLYTLPDKGFAAGDRPEPGPGCWYDERGFYRFANANWLSQILFATAWSLGGEHGLSLLLLGLDQCRTAPNAASNHFLDAIEKGNLDMERVDRALFTQQLLQTAELLRALKAHRDLPDDGPLHKSITWQIKMCQELANPSAD